MARVTFTNNVYPYVKGDVVDLDKDQLAEVDKYIKRWNIKDAYEVEGGKKSAQPKSNKAGSDTKPNKDKAPVAQTGEGDEPKTQGDDSTQTPTADDKTDEAVDPGEDAGNPAVEGDDVNPPVDDDEATEGGDDSGDTTTGDDDKNKK